MMIRKAGFLDIPAIINLGFRYVEEEVKEVCHHSAVWDADLSAQHLCSSIHNEYDFLWVAVMDGETVGFLWGAVHAMAPWNGDPVASDYLFYMTPEYRGRVTGMRLIKEYTQWAKSMGCAEARLSLASGINQERIGKAYTLLGFEPFGAVYRHKYKEK